MPFCKQCGKEIPHDARFCPYCGADQTSTAPTREIYVYETKNTGLTAILALIPGIFGFWGVGHIYVGKIWKGLALLGLGIVLGVLTLFVLPLAILLATKDPGSMIGGIFLLFFNWFRDLRMAGLRRL